jgi:hypothetical protein
MQVSLKDHAAKVLPYWPPGVEKIRVSSGDWMFDMDKNRQVEASSYETSLAFRRLGPCAKTFVGQSCTRDAYSVTVASLYFPTEPANRKPLPEFIAPEGLRLKFGLVDKLKAFGSFVLSLFDKRT